MIRGTRGRAASRHHAVQRRGAFPHDSRHARSRGQPAPKHALRLPLPRSQDAMSAGAMLSAPSFVSSAIVPAVLISACCLLLLTINNRIVAVLTRQRALHR
jgi:hypothetical protein